MNRGLAEMFRYNAWANETLFAFCRTLTHEQLDSKMPGISGSVRELLVHIVGAQQTFILRTKGRQHEGELARESDWPGMDMLLELMRETNNELTAIAEQLDGEAEAELSYMGSSYRYPTRFFLVHAIEHAAEHRTEVKIALGQMGIDTPDLDGWLYADAAGYGQEVE